MCTHFGKYCHMVNEGSQKVIKYKTQTFVESLTASLHIDSKVPLTCEVPNKSYAEGKFKFVGSPQPLGSDMVFEVAFLVQICGQGVLRHISGGLHFPNGAF